MREESEQLCTPSAFGNLLLFLILRLSLGNFSAAAAAARASVSQLSQDVLRIDALSFGVVAALLASAF